MVLPVCVRRLRLWPALLALIAPAAGAAAQTFVSFVFDVPGKESGEPFARELWAEVTTPAGARLRLPAFVIDDARFAVRARADQRGTYERGTVTETTSNGATRVLAVQPAHDRAVVAEPITLPPVQRSANHPRQFALSDGAAFVPVGTNLAWAQGERLPYYRRSMQAFGRHGLNWMRVWMSHWGGLNLDWLPPDLGRSPPPGELSARVAENWDEIVTLAETNGVYLQIVLQHHGQWSTQVNPNWAENPWNAAHAGGFLAEPADFFTSPRARELTKRKYRYIVARWGYSPAVMAWELFNEVHWVDALRLEHDVTAVAAWHEEMAAFIRSHDAYGHLVTTSTDDVQSPIYATMDFLQPHLYATSLLPGIRDFALDPAMLDRPIFYGEFGDDHLPLTPRQKESGIAIVPPVWASLMNNGGQPAQPWLGWQLLDRDRLGELAAVARFVRESGYTQNRTARPFSPGVESEAHVPLVISAGQHWQRRAGPEIVVPLDGSMPDGLADVPTALVGSAGSVRDGYPDRVSFRVNYPIATTVRVTFTDGGRNGATATLRLDGEEVASHVWPPRSSNAESAKRPAELTFAITAGEHVITLVNTGGADWFEFEAIDLGLEAPALAAIGRRDDAFITAWIWHRTGIFALDEVPSVTASLVLREVPAGTWSVAWWDTMRGAASAANSISHSGGDLRLPTPRIQRHAAVVLQRADEGHPASAP